jgi:hypothetical protein
LVKTVAKPSAAEVSVPIATQPATISFWQSLSAFRWATAVVVLIAVLAGGWLIVQNSRFQTRIEQLQAERQSFEQRLAEQGTRSDDLVEQLERERAERERLEKEIAALQPARSNLVSFILFPVSRLRSEGQKPRQLTLPASARLVELKLEVEPEEEYKSYRVEMRRRADDATLWSKDQLRVQSTTTGKTVVVEIPANMLSQGDYRLTLQGMTAAGELDRVANYDFAVVVR